MSSVFATLDTLRTQYKEIVYTDLTLSNVNTQKLLIITANSSKMLSITNDTNVEVVLSVENSDDPNHTKIEFVKLGVGQAFTLDAVSGGMLNFPSACRFWIHVSGAAVTSGKVRFFLWG
jgi:hypothetical protein